MPKTMIMIEKGEGNNPMTPVPLVKESYGHF